MPVGPFAPLRERDFRLVFVAQALSNLGTNLVPVALAFAVLDLGSPTGLGIVLAARMLPTVVFVLVGGVVGDRIPRGRMLRLTNVAAFAVQGATAALLLSGLATIWSLAGLQFLLGAVSAFMTPALMGILPETVEVTRLQQANSLLGLSRSGTAVAGPALAGVLVVAVGAGWAIAADAASYGVAALLFARIAVAAAAAPRLPRRFLADLGDGWREFRSRRWLFLGVIHYGLSHLLVVAPLMVLGPVVAKESLGGAAAWATIAAAGGAGSVLGGLAALWLRPRRPLVAGFLARAAPVPQAILLAVAGPVWAIALAGVVGQAGLMFCSAIWNASVQERIPRDRFARVYAWDALGSFVLLPVGLALAAPVAALAGTGTTLAVAAGWLAVSTLVVVGVPEIRGLRSSLPGPAVSVKGA